jgi:hypothetical protein
LSLWLGRLVLTHNFDGSPLCWYFITVSRQPQPIEKLMMKLATNVQKSSVCSILAENCSTADCSSVCQHSGKPHVSGSGIYYVSFYIF